MFIKCLLRYFPGWAHPKLAREECKQEAFLQSRGIPTCLSESAKCSRAGESQVVREKCQIAVQKPIGKWLRVGSSSLMVAGFLFS